MFWIVTLIMGIINGMISLQGFNPRLPSFNGPTAEQAELGKPSQRTLNREGE